MRGAAVLKAGLLRIAEKRLASQRLLGERCGRAAEVVAWLGAVQAQDYAGAKWGIAQRMRNATSAGLDAAFDRGEIIRTHILRPTWHFVCPGDLRWLLDLTAARVHQANRAQYRRLELDRNTLRKAFGVITRALEGGQQLTRAELGQRLAQQRIDVNGQRLAYIVMHAELDGLVCSGALQGRQHTYALVDERIPASPKLAREEALGLLARRYFSSHGPATAHDFAWWSGLTVTEARRAIAQLDAELESYAVDGKTYWWAGAVQPVRLRKPDVQLLPNYDEHVVAYRDHGPSLDARAPDALRGWGSGLTSHLVVVNGLVVGGWRRTITETHVAVQLKLLVPPTRAERQALARAAKRYGEFIGLPVTGDIP